MELFFFICGFIWLFGRGGCIWVAIAHWAIAAGIIIVRKIKLYNGTYYKQSYMKMIEQGIDPVDARNRCNYAYTRDGRICNGGFDPIGEPKLPEVKDAFRVRRALHDRDYYMVEIKTGKIYSVERDSRTHKYLCYEIGYPGDYHRSIAKDFEIPEEWYDDFKQFKADETQHLKETNEYLLPSDVAYKVGSYRDYTYAMAHEGALGFDERITWADEWKDRKAKIREYVMAERGRLEKYRELYGELE